MPKNCIKYKDVWAAPNSDLFKAIKEGDMEKAAKIYKECQDRAKKYS